jgi:hypothetical protein
VIRPSLRHLVFLVLIVMSVTIATGSVAAQRDPLASVVEMEAPQLQTVPPNIFATEQRDSITGVVNEARLFGVPLVVRVIQTPTPLGLLSDAGAIAGAAPSAQEITERMAEEWLAREGVETSLGAEDGILLLVVIPEGNHQLTTAAFATGDNALPLNGLTRDRLDHVITTIMPPHFADNTIAAGIHSGIAHLSYDNLFAVPARLQRTEQQERLRDLTNSVLVGMTGLGVLALGGLTLWIRRRDSTRIPAVGDTLSPFEAGALALGRVDEPVVTAALLHMVDRGILRVSMGHAGVLTLAINPDITTVDPFEQQILNLLATEAGQDDRLPNAAVRRVQDVLAPAREWLQDDLARRNLFNRDAKIETLWIILGSAALGILALFSLVPSIVAMSRYGLFTFGIAMLMVAGALTWAVRRSWTTGAGQRILATWLSTRLHPEDAAIYDTIVHQDALLATPGGPDTQPSVRMARELRALGPG